MVEGTCGGGHIGCGGGHVGCGGRQNGCGGGHMAVVVEGTRLWWRAPPMVEGTPAVVEGTRLWWRAHRLWWRAHGCGGGHMAVVEGTPGVVEGTRLWWRALCEDDGGGHTGCVGGGHGSDGGQVGTVKA